MKWNEWVGVIFGMASSVLALIIVFADILGFISFEITFKGMIASLCMMGVGICFMPFNPYITTTIKKV